MISSLWSACKSVKREGRGDGPALSPTKKDLRWEKRVRMLVCTGVYSPALGGGEKRGAKK